MEVTESKSLSIHTVHRGLKILGQNSCAALRKPCIIDLSAALCPQKMFILKDTSQKLFCSSVFLPGCPARMLHPSEYCKLIQAFAFMLLSSMLFAITRGV